MGSFQERLAALRQNPEDQMRRVVNSAAMPFTSHADRLHERLTSEGWFRGAKILDFLVDMENFAKYNDEHPHPDAMLEFTLYEPAPSKEDTEQIIATATLKFDFTEGEQGEGYKFVKVDFTPLGGIFEITGQEKESLWYYGPDESKEDLEKAIVNAYDNPGTMVPIGKAPDDKTPVEPYQPIPDDVPKDIHFLSIYPGGDDELGDGKL